MDKALVEDSKLLKYYLRHHPEEVGCVCDKYGWIDVHTLCKNSKFTLSYLEEIVEQDTRCELSNDLQRIRAFHGHSVPGVVPYEEIKPNGIIFHGTSKVNLKKIKQDGCIKSMSRNYVHSSYDETVAKAIGSRHGSPVILCIDAKRAYEDGIKFYESGDNVMLSEEYY